MGVLKPVCLIHKILFVIELCEDLRGNVTSLHVVQCLLLAGRTVLLQQRAVSQW